MNIRLYFIPLLFINATYPSDNNIENKIRTDGIYIFDNGLDSIATIPEMLELVQILSNPNKGSSVSRQIDCIPSGVNVVNSHYTTELNFLYFQSKDSVFYTKFVCRRKNEIDKNIRIFLTERYKHNLNSEEIDLTTASNILIKEQHIKFETGSKSNFSHTIFDGNAYHDSIVFELKWPFYPIFNSTKDEYRYRTMHFYSFHTIDSILKGCSLNQKIFFKSSKY